MTLGNLVRDFCLENIFAAQTDVGFDGGYPDLVVKVSVAIVLTELDGPQFDLETLVIGLVGLHRAHGTEPCIAAAL